MYTIKNTQIFSTNMSFKKVPFYFTFNKESLFKTKNKITSELLKDLLLKINSELNIVIKERKFELSSKFEILFHKNLKSDYTRDKYFLTV